MISYLFLFYMFVIITTCYTVLFVHLLMLLALLKDKWRQHLPAGGRFTQPEGRFLRVLNRTWSRLTPCHNLLWLCTWVAVCSPWPYPLHWTAGCPFVWRAGGSLPQTEGSTHDAAYWHPQAGSYVPNSGTHWGSCNQCSASPGRAVRIVPVAAPWKFTFGVVVDAAVRISRVHFPSWT